MDENFDKHDIPYDVLWLDIEHTDNKKWVFQALENIAITELQMLLFHMEIA